MFHEGQAVLVRLPKGGIVQGTIKTIYSINGESEYVVKYKRSKGPNRDRTVHVRASDMRAV